MILREVIFIICFFFWTLVLYGQGPTTYRIVADQMPLPILMDSLETKYGLLWSYKPEDVEGKIVTADLETKDLNELLFKVMVQHGLSFEIINDKYIILKPDTLPLEICGNIRDRVSDQVLPAANVFIQGTTIGVSSDDHGDFRFNIPPSQKHKQITVSYLGYKSASFSLFDFVQGDCLNIVMEVDMIDLEEYVIIEYLTGGVNMSKEGASITIEPNEITNFPGQVEPIIQEAIQLLPGVKNPSPKVSDLFIRGGTPDQNLLLWESIPVYHSAHYFGMISAINPYIIESADVYRSGFGVEYGGRLAGVVDMTAYNNKEKYGVGFNMTHVYMDGYSPMDFGNDGGITFSLRKSYDDLLSTPTSDNITAVNQQGLLLGDQEITTLPDHISVDDRFDFIDAQVKISTSISSKDRISFSTIYADNSFTDRIQDRRREEYQLDSMDLNNLGLNLQWNRMWNKDWSSELRFIHADYSYRYDYQIFNEVKNKSRLRGCKANSITDNQLQLDVQGKFSPSVSARIGYHLINYDLSFEVEEDSPKTKKIDDRDDSDSQLHAIYTNFRVDPTQKLSLTPGIRISYFGKNETMYFEPRINLNYSINQSWSVNAFAGRFKQFVSQLTVFRGNNSGISTPLWVLGGSKESPVQSADYLQVGVVFLKNSWVVDFQAYTRGVSGLTSRAFDFKTTEIDEPILGKSEIKGIDILIKKRFKNFKSWLSYSYSDVIFNFNSLTERQFPADFNQPHTLAWTNQWTKGKLGLSLGYRYGSGLPYTTMDAFNVDSDQNQDFQYTPIYGALNGQRLTSFQELNFSAQFTTSFLAESRLYIAFSLINILDRENVYDRLYYVDTPRNRSPFITYRDKIDFRRTPNLNIRIEF